jgi:hypothetical protein
MVLGYGVEGHEFKFCRVSGFFLSHSANFCPREEMLDHC